MKRAQTLESCNPDRDPHAVISQLRDSRQSPVVAQSPHSLVGGPPGAELAEYLGRRSCAERDHLRMEVGQGG